MAAPGTTPRGTRHIGVVLVDDNAGYRQVLRVAIERHPALRVLAEAQDGQEGLRAASQHMPDVVVTDVYMPVMGGFELAEELLRSAPDVAVVMVAGLPDARLRSMALNAGVAAFVEKSDGLQHLVEVVHDVAGQART